MGNIAVSKKRDPKFAILRVKELLCFPRPVDDEHDPTDDSRDRPPSTHRPSLPASNVPNVNSDLND